MLFRSDRKSTRLNSSHTIISYAVFCLKKKNRQRAGTGRGRTAAGPGRKGRRRDPAVRRLAGTLLARGLLVVDCLRGRLVFFFIDGRPPETSPLSLHDALPI